MKRSIKVENKKALPDGHLFFIRPTFMGYLRELYGLEDPYEKFKNRLKEFNQNK